MEEGNYTLLMELSFKGSFKMVKYWEEDAEQNLMDKLKKNSGH